MADLSPDESSDQPPVACLFGSYAPKPGEPLYELAYHIGHALAGAGYVVANGGYGGIMRASAKGAKDAGGSTIGVTCSLFTDSRGHALKPNHYIDREILHVDLQARIEEMIQMASAFGVLEGGTGTLSEFGTAWEYVAKGVIDPKPIFIVGPFWQPTVNAILAVRPHHGQHLHCVESTEEIVRIATSAVTN